MTPQEGEWDQKTEVAVRAKTPQPPIEPESLEEVFLQCPKVRAGRDWIRGQPVNLRVKFYNRFEREMEERDRDFEKKYAKP